MTIDPEQSWRAWRTHDRRFDGRVFMGVTSTGIYCRPVCPARLPARRNASFFASAAAAESAGFRPCRRCRPETAPGSAAWRGTSATVARALRLIDAGELDARGVEGVAERLGVTGRWLRLLFERQLGASPLDVARTRRVHFARRLLDETRLPLEEVALASGFASARRLRAAVQQTFRRPPSSLRGAGAPAADAPLSLRVSARAPFDGGPLLAFLGARTIPGVESVEGRRYRRTVRVAGAPAVLDVELPAGEAAVCVRLTPAPLAALLSVVSRVSRLFDLEADAAGIAAQLRAADPRLARALRGRVVRVPGAWDPFEMSIRALLGQQISVAAARTLAGRLVRACGEPLPAPDGALSHVFPAPAAVAAAPLETLGLTRARAAAIRNFAAAVAQGSLDFGTLGALDEAVATLVKLPGIGPWTAQVIAMRALAESDAFPAGDLGVRHALAAGGRTPDERTTRRLAERWRPWRAYATMALWTAPARPANERRAR